MTNTAPGRVYWSITGSTTRSQDNSYQTGIAQHDGDIIIHFFAGLYLTMPVNVWRQISAEVDSIIGVPA